MQRWALVIAYDGRGFSGWQKQPHHVSAQQTLEEAVFQFSGERTKIVIAGRTDAGVHAMAQVAHMDLAKNMEPDRLMMAINALARPHPVSVLRALKVRPDFHARFDAGQRSYIYRIINRRAPLTFEKGLAWQVPRPLNEQAMQQASQSLLGKHDFSAFRAMGCQAKHPIRSIDSITVTRQGEEITIHVVAKSFLYHQVRNMVGTLVKIGVGEWPVEQMQQILESRDRTLAGMTAPADGLYFERVTYPDVSLG